MKKYIYISLTIFIIGLLGAFFVACSDSDDLGGLKGLETHPEEKYNAKICVISALKDASTVNSLEQADAISKYIESKASDAFLVMVDRADVTYSKEDMKNPIVSTADKTDRFSAMAFNRFNGNIMESSYLLVDSYNFYGLKTDKKNGMHASRSEISTKIANDCYMKTLEDVMFKGTNSELPEGEQNIKYARDISTLRLNSSDHIKSYISNVVAKVKVQNPILLHFGTVKSSLNSEFKTAVADLDEDYILSIVEGTETAEYSIFLLAHKNFWAIKSVTKDNVAPNIDAYTLNLMW